MRKTDVDEKELALARERNKRFSTGKATLNELRREAGLPEIKDETFDRHFWGSEVNSMRNIEGGENNKKEAAKVDIETANAERMGFFHGERKEAMERAVNKIWEVMKEENLSMMQAEQLVPMLNRYIQERRSELLSNTVIE